MPRERILDPQATSPEEQAQNYALRPQQFDQYVGQPALVHKLQIAVEAARRRGEPVDHTLLHGPPGLGKTTLAHVIANEVGARVHVTSGPALTKGADLLGILTRLERGDVLFIDEIHRLPAVVEEYLYPAMEDYKVDIPLDSGMHARAVTMSLQPFTLIGATTRLGLLTGPMRGRFGISEHLDFYDTESLEKILFANASKLGLAAEPAALRELAGRSRGTPRVANRLLRRARDYAQVHGDGRLTAAIVRQSLELEGIDALGLDEQDRAFLRTVIDVYACGPVGIDAIAATLGEERDTLEDVVEPFLLQKALLTRTRQGRRATRAACAHLGLPYQSPGPDDPGLFSEAP
jgi:Holliday junction DNA helicase RuvB